MSAYQTARYDVVLVDGAYAVRDLRGRIYGDRLTLGEACALADLYQADDDSNDAEERHCAELDAREPDDDEA